MTLEDFSPLIDKLAAFYSKKPSEAAKEAWFQKFRDVDPQDWFVAYETITDEEKTFPTPKQMKNAVYDAKSSRLAQDRRSENFVGHGTVCAKCEDTGTIAATRDGLAYVFRCGFCEAHKEKLAEWVLFWNQKYKEQGYEIRNVVCEVPTSEAIKRTLEMMGGTIA